jgi:putative ABC transport system permease protein
VIAMLWLQNLATAFEQLWANKGRSLLTVLGIIIAVTSTIVVVAVVQGFSGYIADFLQGMGTNAMWVIPERPPEHRHSRPVPAEMVQADIDEVEATAATVARIAPFVVREVKVAQFNREIVTQMVGTAPDFQYIRNFFVDVGRCFGPIELDNKSQVCLLGRDVVRKLEVNEGIVGDYVTINRKRFRVIGLLEHKGSFLGESMDDVLLIPYTTAIKMFPQSRRRLGFMAQSSRPDLVPESKAEIINALRRRHGLSPSQPNDFRIFTQDEILEQFFKVSVVGTAVLGGLVGISLLVGGIGIMNVMLVSVTERTREIGLRKAVGARRRDILAQFLTEAVVLSVSGGLVGIALGYGLTYLAALHPQMIDVSVPLWAVVLGMGFSALVGVVFGFLPAFKAAILPPIDALRYE